MSLPQLAHTLLPTQIRLAQIVEMIHVASLLHDDVIDKSDLRRGAPSAPAAFGNKLAVLGGDFLLGRASAALSRLGDSEVVELIASVIANLVEGEILQMKGTGARANVDAPSDEIDILNLHAQPSRAEVPFPDRWSTYLKKTYLKTASLMAKGARAAVVLGGCKEGEVWKEVAYAYGRNVGIAFQVGYLSFRYHLVWRFRSGDLTRSQLVDDILDFSSSTALGKPGSGADLRLGLATGPVLYAAEEYPELEPLIARGFKHDGDVEQVSVVHHCFFRLSTTFPPTRIGSNVDPCFIRRIPDTGSRTSICRKSEGSAWGAPRERGKGGIGGIDGWGCQARVVSMPLRRYGTSKAGGYGYQDIARSDTMQVEHSELSPVDLLRRASHLRPTGTRFLHHSNNTL